jgi:hypothetical protein
VRVCFVYVLLRSNHHHRTFAPLNLFFIFYIESHILLFTRLQYSTFSPQKFASEFEITNYIQFDYYLCTMFIQKIYIGKLTVGLIEIDYCYFNVLSLRIKSLNRLWNNQWIFSKHILIISNQRRCKANHNSQAPFALLERVSPGQL